MELKGLLTGERVDMNFGNPVDISDIKRMNMKGLKKWQTVFKQNLNRLDAENATYHTNKNQIH